MTLAVPGQAPDRGPAPVLHLRGVSKTLRDGERRFRLECPEFAVRPGDRLALVGRNGTGKTTLLHLLACAAGPDTAEVFTLADRTGAPIADVAQAWRAGDDRRLATIRARHFGYLPQDSGLLGFLTVRQNIALALELAASGQRRPSAAEISASIPPGLQILHLLDRYPRRLSGGQRQQAALARALAHRPLVILADEPTAALDPANAAQAVAMLVEIAAAQQAALVVASHDHALVGDTGFTLIEPTVTQTDGIPTSSMTRQA